MTSTSRSKARPPVPDEAATWRAVGASWRQLFGNFQRLGVSFEWHELETSKAIDWARSFHPESVELCLNLTGEAEVTAGSETARYGAGMVGFYRQGAEPLTASRGPGQTHQFITVELSPTFLARHLGPGTEDLHPLIRRVVSGTDPQSGVALPAPVNARQRELINTLRQPPVLASAQSLWYQAKAIELMGEFFFQAGDDEELFCHRQQRVARDRVEAVQAILRRDLVNAPSLEVIAREVGCSPFYLSRTFSKETGGTIPQYLRQLRMDRAAELLRTGRFNVTEVALEVGYNSLSHFSQSFHQTFGCCPGLYPPPGGLRTGGKS
jgi:AraC family transcriptional regulator